MELDLELRMFCLMIKLRMNLKNKLKSLALKVKLSWNRLVARKTGAENTCETPRFDMPLGAQV